MASRVAGAPNVGPATGPRRVIRVRWGELKVLPLSVGLLRGGGGRDGVNASGRVDDLPLDRPEPAAELKPTPLF